MTDEATSSPATVDIPHLKDLAEFRYRLRTFLSFSEAASERQGIQAQQYQLMQVIAALPPTEQASITYLADRMVLRHNSTVELVDRAEKAGLVARHNDARDLRRSLVQLTPKGASILHGLIIEHMAEVRRISDNLIQALQALQETVETPAA
jgi:DNA-binding MarR family transcriptional regulator